MKWYLWTLLGVAVIGIGILGWKGFSKNGWFMKGGIAGSGTGAGAGAGSGGATTPTGDAVGTEEATGTGAGEGPTKATRMAVAS